LAAGPADGRRIAFTAPMLASRCTLVGGGGGEYEQKKNAAKKMLTRTALGHDPAAEKGRSPDRQASRRATWRRHRPISGAAGGEVAPQQLQRDQSLPQERWKLLHVLQEGSGRDGRDAELLVLESEIRRINATAHDLRSAFAEAP
jgi:hypothetical protein